MDIDKITSIYTKVGRVLSGVRNLTVEFQPEAKSSAYNSDAKRIILNLPPLFTKRHTEKFIYTAAAHELAHVIWTDGKRDGGGALGLVENAMEDIRVERKLFRRFPGVEEPVRAINRVFAEGFDIDKMFDEILLLASLLMKEEGEIVEKRLPEKIRDDRETILETSGTGDFGNLPDTNAMRGAAAKFLEAAKSLGYFLFQKPEPDGEGEGEFEQDGESDSNSPNNSQESKGEETKTKKTKPKTGQGEAKETAKPKGQERQETNKAPTAGSLQREGRALEQAKDREWGKPEKNASNLCQIFELDYKPKDTFLDIAKGKGHGITDSIEGLILSEHQALRRAFEELFVPQKKSHFKVGELSGKVNPRALPGVAFDKNDLFRRRIVPRKFDLVASIIIDMSGSMYDNSAAKINQAASSAYAITKSLEALNAKVEIMGFAVDNNTKPSPITNEEGSPIYTVIPMGMIIAKPFKKKVAKQQLKDLRAYGFIGVFAEGEAIRIGLNRVKKVGTRLSSRMIFILCDGFQQFTEQGKVIAKYKEVAKKSGIALSVIGIGEGCRRIKNTYGADIAAWAPNANALPKILFRKLKDIVGRR